MIAPVAAGGFVGLLSMFNMGGRFFWSSASDFIGRKPTYFIFLALGAVLYLFLPMTGGDHMNSVKLFVAVACVLLSMYGGGFATIPAYLRDLFGSHNVSAIHGRLLTAWSTAGVLGPVLVNNMREYELAHGVDKAGAYQTVMHIMAGLLVGRIHRELVGQAGGGEILAAGFGSSDRVPMRPTRAFSNVYLSNRTGVAKDG